MDRNLVNSSLGPTLKQVRSLLTKLKTRLANLNRLLDCGTVGSISNESAQCSEVFLEFFEQIDAVEKEYLHQGGLEDEKKLNAQIISRFKVFIDIVQVFIAEISLHFLPPNNARIKLSTIGPDGNSAVRFAVHACSQSCAKESLVTSGSENVLCIPFLNGFRREVVRRVSNKKKVLYIAPCGSVIDDMNTLRTYLTTTKSKLKSEMFTFVISVEPRRIYEVAKVEVKLEISDLSNGVEPSPIPVINEIDMRAVSISPYVLKPVFNPSIEKELVDDVNVCCNCQNDCAFDAKCECRLRSSVKLDYCGRLRKMGNGLTMYECSKRCACLLANCTNRVTQQGRTSLLQTFRTIERGWGVRSIVDVPMGCFIISNSGIVLPEDFAENYGIFVTDKYFIDIPQVVDDCQPEHKPFVLDLATKSNVSKFFNASCEPNMFLVRVFGEIRDRRFPTLAFFTLKNINAGDELTWDYAYQLNDNRAIACKCGSKKCRGRLL